jgi:hypothetical protein
MESIEEIIHAIATAFVGVGRGQVTLHEAEVMDVYGSEVERREARRRDPEDDWTTVPAASLEECPSALSFLDPESWRFYLPAYMRLALRHFGLPHNSAIDQAIYFSRRGQAGTSSGPESGAGPGRSAVPRLRPRARGELRRRVRETGARHLLVVGELNVSRAAFD